MKNEGMFRTLTPAEELEFQAWARANYQPLSTIEGFWHPAIQAECAKINAEAGAAFNPQAELEKLLGPEMAQRAAETIDRVIKSQGN